MLSKRNKITKVDDRLKRIAFIMDGNGRWAQKRLAPRSLGHKYGASAFKRIVKYCYELGIKTVTTYAFSTEHWSRPKSEVDSIIQLLHDYTAEVIEDGRIRIRFIGERANLSSELVEVMNNAEEKTKDREYQLNIAFNYGGRSEIVNACNRLISQGKESVTEDDISNNLYTSGLPDPDLIVRTAGEVRMSNFLLWQLAYSEFYFTDVLWPDFDKKHLLMAIESFYKRERRYGGLNKTKEKK